MKKIFLPDDWFFILLALSILFHFVFPTKRIIPHPANFTGILIFAIGIAITLSVNFLLLRSDTSIKPFDSPRLLVTSGLFKFSRNPLYLGMVIAHFGVNIFIGSISPFIFSILFIIIIDRYYIPIEEENLERNFNKEFNEYKKKVRRWI